MSSFPRCEALPARRALLLIAAPLTPGLYRPWLSRLDRTSETRWQHAEQESSDGGVQRDYWAEPAYLP